MPFLRQIGRGGRIRTGDFSLPKRARYQAAPRPDPLIVLAAALADRLGGSRPATVTLSAPDGRVATELELVVVAIDGKGGAARPLTDAERAALAS
jgi:hypothetical protein